MILSVGIHRVVGRAFEALPWPDAIALAGGVALYLIGHAAFLWLFGLPGVPHRLGAAAVVLATIPLGHLIAIAQLAAIPITMVAAATIEDVLEVRRTGRTEIRSFGRTAGPE